MHETDMRYYAGLAAGSACEFWPILPRPQNEKDTPTYWMSKAIEYYDAGADGLGFWDMHGLDSSSSCGPVALRLGHLDEVRTRLQRDEPTLGPVLHPLDHLGDLDMRVRSVPQTCTERLYPNGVPCHVVWWPG